MTQDDLDKLEAALAKGARRVTFADGRAVEFHSFEELVQRINYVKRELSQEAAQRRHLAKYTKGVQS